ncbi:hypothetical protein [Ralstonia pseudosolanacearum]|uniref:hypothetical protein n=1 Tax=Ralstonia pseudosolanacearum TaxID=1310165 RepID=UPI003CF91D90
MKKEVIFFGSLAAAAAIAAAFIALAPKYGDTPPKQAAEAPVSQPVIEQHTGPRQWYAADVNHSACFLSTKGPAGQIEELDDGANPPTVKEFKNNAGALYKIEVVKRISLDEERYWTYYLSQETCVAEQVHDTKALADKYR